MGLLVEDKSNGVILEIFTLDTGPEEFPTIIFVETFETVWFKVDKDDKFWALVEGKSNEEVLDVFKLKIFTEEFPTLTNLLEVAIMLVDKFETFCVGFIVDWDEKL